MTCPRCGGWMTLQMHFLQGDRCESLSCLHCGECVDKEILANRKASLPRYKESRENRRERVTMWEVR